MINLSQKKFHIEIYYLLYLYFFVSDSFEFWKKLNLVRLFNSFEKSFGNLGIVHKRLQANLSLIVTPFIIKASVLSSHLPPFLPQDRDVIYGRSLEGNL